MWLAFFLYDVLTQFAGLAREREDATFAERCLAEAKQLQENIERNAWDGEWYRRAYFDNGEPLGSKTNPECQIDSMPQSWSVISGAGESARARQAMQAVNDASSGATPNLSSFSLRRSTNRRSIQATSKATSPECARTAANTRMALSGRPWPSRSWATTSAHGNFSICSIPSTTAERAEQIATYKVEPYVVAADVYAVAPHIGRGGWTWYTGSAGWMYRFLTETLLGIHLEGNRLRITLVFR